MRANRFFSSVVRIQKDRGHVVSDGPYRIVRHPGYTGMAAFTLVTPLILNSRYAFIPAAITIAVWVLRTALEDRTLRGELEGYAAYAKCVKYRLAPYIWQWSPIPAIPPGNRTYVLQLPVPLLWIPQASRSWDPY